MVDGVVVEVDGVEVVAVGAFEDDGRLEAVVDFCSREEVFEGAVFDDVVGREVFYLFEEEDEVDDAAFFERLRVGGRIRYFVLKENFSRFGFIKN